MSAISSPTAQQATFAYAKGDVIAGKYALEDMLGEGGMGAVFRARNTAIDMPVAIKVIRADLDRELLSGRLLQEARAAAKLAHPAIVRVFDVGMTALGDPFIVMELLEGESLAAMIDRDGRLSSVRAVQLLLPIADALSVAHAKGFVHRDVKPDNVFIANDEEGQLQPKLVDFGIVKHEQRLGDKLTQVGAVVGSPDYMSPEQARGLDSIDLRSDVWSFSVVLYESVTGHTPFSSHNYNALLRLIVEAEPASLLELSAADAELSAIVSKGLSKEPNSRWPSLGQMGRALAGWLLDQGVSEDACGVSLEARWLGRSSDPSDLAARATRSSFPAGWPEPPSGIRAVGKLGHAATLRASRSSGTPLSLSQTPAPLARFQRRHAAVALGLVLAAVAIAALRASSVPSPAPRALPPSAAAPVQALPVAAPPPPVDTAPESNALPDPMPDVELPAPRKNREPRVGSPAPARPAASARTPAPSAAPVVTPPESDLLSPY